MRAHLGQRRSWPATALGVLIAAGIAAVASGGATSAGATPVGTTSAGNLVDAHAFWTPAVDDSRSVVAELRRLHAVPAVLP